MSFTTELQTVITRYANSVMDCRDQLKRCLLSVEGQEKYDGLLATSCQYGFENSAIHWAAVRGDDDMVRCFLESLTPIQRYNLLCAQNSYGCTAIHWAAIGGAAEVVRCLLDSLKPDHKYDVLLIQSCNGSTPVHEAALGGHTTSLRIMLNGIDGQRKLQKLLEIECLSGNTALDGALARNHLGTAECIRELLSTGKTQSYCYITLNFNNTIDSSR